MAFAEQRLQTVYGHSPIYRHCRAPIYGQSMAKTGRISKLASSGMARIPVQKFFLDEEAAHPAAPVFINLRHLSVLAANRDALQLEMAAPQK